LSWFGTFRFLHFFIGSLDQVRLHNVLARSFDFGIAEFLHELIVELKVLLPYFMIFREDLIGLFVLTESSTFSFQSKELIAIAYILVSSLSYDVEKKVFLAVESKFNFVLSLQLLMRC